MVWAYLMLILEKKRQAKFEQLDQKMKILQELAEEKKENKEG